MPSLLAHYLEAVERFGASHPDVVRLRAEVPANAASGSELSDFRNAKAAGDQVDGD